MLNFGIDRELVECNCAESKRGVQREFLRGLGPFRYQARHLAMVPFSASTVAISSGFTLHLLFKVGAVSEKITR